jgi:hypothetical protein
MNKLCARVSLVASILSGGSLLTGCGERPTSGVEEIQGEIIGGTGIDINTRRVMGLVNVNGGCSGTMIDRDTVVSATHCMDLNVLANNNASMPRPGDGVLETRTATGMVRVGTGDITLLKLGALTANWPTVTRSEKWGDPNSLVNTSITCYGQGATAYLPGDGGGLTGFGTWKKITRKIESYDPTANTFFISSVNGDQTTAPGDSGGPCLAGDLQVAIDSASQYQCADRRDADVNCKATITKILNTRESSTMPYADYITQARSRSAAFFRPLTLVNGWTSNPFSTNFAGVAVVGGVVHLRGGISAGTTGVAFTLPPDARPSSTVYVPTNTADATKGRLMITTDGVVTVQSEGTFTNASNFTSLDGISFVMSATGSSAIPLLGGWTNAPFGTRMLKYRDDGGLVRLQGAIATTGTNDVAFTMPAGLRPPTDVYLPIDLCGAKKGRLHIYPTGAAQVSGEGGFSAAQCFTSLEGVWFQTTNAGTQLDPMNGWTSAPFSTRPVRVANRSGIVGFQGALATSGTNMAALALPQQFWPATDVYVEADLCGATKGRIHITRDGTVYVQAQGSIGNAQCFTSLEGIEYGI